MDNLCYDFRVEGVHIHVNVESLSEELRFGLCELSKYSAVTSISISSDISTIESANTTSIWKLEFVLDELLPPRQYEIITQACPNSKIKLNIINIQIRYRRMIEAFRALGNIIGISVGISDIQDSSELIDTLNTYERANFDTMGVMVDCSRNGVLLVKSAKELIRKMSLMGFNMLQLYTEDTYEIKDEPFFGYLRGRYTYSELKSIDDYAFNFGIEVIPCIQTLGHLSQVLQWHRYYNLRDTHEVLLAGSEETYTFIKKMIESAIAPFRSRRIHIGMDEAHGISEGRYRVLFGLRDPIQVFTEHLHKVTDICLNLGVKPMIWSDMLFCLATRNLSLQGYYDVSSNPATSDFGGVIPNELELVYWDYYHTTSETYRQKVQQHREFGHNPWMAAGAWTWNRFWCALPFTFETIRACMKGTKDQTNGGVKNAMITIWGDEGNECDIFSSLPGLLYYADHGYTMADEVDIVLLKRKFAGIVGADFDAWVWASRLDDLTPENIPLDDKAHFTPNMSKFLFWNEPFYSFIDPQYQTYDLEKHYVSLSASLYKSLSESTYKGPNSMQKRLEFAALISTTLGLKCHLRTRLRECYLANDLVGLRELVQGRLMRLRQQVDQLWRYHRDMWMQTYKPFGWEVLEIRYGGLRARLETMWYRLMNYITSKERDINNDLEFDEELKIPELEEELLEIYENTRTNIILDWQRASRPGV